MGSEFYTVKDLAKRLGAKEDTIRRWIASEKLTTKIYSKKGGHMISSEELFRFLNSHPKYAARFAETLPISPVAIGAIMAGMLGGLMTLANSKKESRVTADDVRHSMDMKIDNLEKELAAERAKVEKLMAEIEAKQETLNNYFVMANQMDADMIADQINSNIQAIKEDAE